MPAAKNLKAYKHYFAYSLIIILVFFIYGWTYTFDFGMDDNYVRDIVNDINKNWTNFGSIFSQRLGDDYRPISNLFFWLESYFFDGLHAPISHLINTFLFAINCILIYYWLKQVTFFQEEKIQFAFILVVTLFFIVHPVHISVVGNIKSRDNLLSMLFGLLSLIQVTAYFKTSQKWRFVLYLLFLLIANLSKPDAYVFMLIPFLYFFVYERYSLNKKTIIKIIISFLVIFIIYAFSTDSLKNYFVGSNIDYYSHSDSPLAFHDSFIHRLSFSLTTMWHYLKFFILPYGYQSYYGFNQIPLRPLFSFWNIISFLVYLFILVFSILKYKKQKLYLFSFLFYLLSIGYAANLAVIVSGNLADRYMFIASLGLCMFSATLVMEYLQPKNWKVLFNPMLFLILLLLIGLNFYKTKDWKDKETLFLSDIKHGTQSAHVYQMLSSIYLNNALFADISNDERDTQMVKAIQYIDKGLSITKKDPMLLENKGITLIYNLEPNQAKIYFRKALSIDTFLYTNINHLGICFRNENNLDSALYYFEMGMNKDAMFGYAANNYVETLIKQERYKSVDSVIRILEQRFPTDKYLKQKINDLHQKGIWYVY